MSPGMRGNWVSSMRMPTEWPKMFCPPRTRVTCLFPLLVELGELLSRFPEVTFHGLVVLGVRELGQIALPVREAPLDLAQVAPGDAAIPPLARGFRIEDQEAIDGADDLVPGLALPVDGLEVGKYPPQELPARHRRVVLVRQRHFPPEDPPHELLAALGGQEGPRIERVEKDLRIVEARARDEMPRQPYPLHGEPQALAHLDQDEGQRDGNALPSIEHVVEEAVAGVVVVLAIACEALLHEEVFAKPVQAAQGIGRAPRPVNAAREPVESLQVGVHLERRVLPLGDGEGGPREIETTIGPRDQLGKLAERWIGAHQQPGA